MNESDSVVLASKSSSDISEEIFTHISAIEILLTELACRDDTDCENVLEKLVNFFQRNSQSCSSG